MTMKRKEQDYLLIAVLGPRSEMINNNNTSNKNNNDDFDDDY